MIVPNARKTEEPAGTIREAFVISRRGRASATGSWVWERALASPPGGPISATREVLPELLSQKEPGSHQGLDVASLVVEHGQQGIEGTSPRAHRDRRRWSAALAAIR